MVYNINEKICDMVIEIYQLKRNVILPDFFTKQKCYRDHFIRNLVPIVIISKSETPFVRVTVIEGD